MTTPRAAQPINPRDDDPFLWLEEIEGSAAVTWVAQQRSRVVSRFFAGVSEALAQFSDAPRDEGVPYIVRRGRHVYQSWKTDPQAQWWRAEADHFLGGGKTRETLIGAAIAGNLDGRKLTITDAASCPPDFDRALISLSSGGADAIEIREFDLTSKQFIHPGANGQDGFFLPTAHCSAIYENRDTVLFGHAIGPDHTTMTGQPRTIRRWRRGQPISEAEIIFGCEQSHIGVGVTIDWHPMHGHIAAVRYIDYLQSEFYVAHPGQPFRKLDVPLDATVTTGRHFFVIRPRRDWLCGTTRVPGGGVAIGDLASFLAGRREVQVVFDPTRQRVYEDVCILDDTVLITLIENAASRIDIVHNDGTGSWTVSALEGLPEPATYRVRPFDAPDAVPTNDALIEVESFTEPVSLLLWDASTPAAAPELVRSQRPFFDATGVETLQLDAIAVDGERIPYFLVGRRDAVHDGSRPLILTGYGGFEQTERPRHEAFVGKLWLESGGLYAVANLRGGGAYGPAWHEAGRRRNKSVSHDDFAAVARDVIRRGFTQPAALGCMGGSNGGLLVGNMITRYPELFAAVVCQIPLLDMARYMKLSVGQIWMTEYGDPDDPAEWAFIRAFSPYHNLVPGQKYPPTLFVTASNDDRVHPGHARKMAARMLGFGADVWLWESKDGGHGKGDVAAWTNAALEFTFFRHMIGADLTPFPSRSAAERR